MKIASFAQKHEVTEATVRYYMQEGLLVPIRKNKQYDFDEGCSKNIEFIKLLRDIGFSVAQIKNIILYKAFIDTTGYRNFDNFMTFFMNKKENLLVEREKLDDKIKKLDKTIENLRINQNQNIKIKGVPIDFLKHLYCPICQIPLNVIEGKVENGEMINGKLGCSCGFSARIEDGIIIVEDLDKQSSYPKFENIKESIIKNTFDPSFVKLILSAINWGLNKFESIKMSDKIILKYHTGYATFSSKLSDILPEDYCYISMDEEIEFLRDIKKTMQINGAKAKWIYICTDINRLPLKNGSIDLIIDKVFNPDMDNFREKYVIEILQEKLRDGGNYIGSYLYLADNMKPKLMPSKFLPYLKLENIKNSLSKIFREIDSQDFGCMAIEDKQDDYFMQKGDKTGMWCFLGEKNI